LEVEHGAMSTLLLVNADDMYVGGNDMRQLLIHWSAVLEKMFLNNLKLNAVKTVICPIQTNILGWIWHSGTLSVSSHKISALITTEPPKTCSAMKSYIGAYKAMSQCIPRYASLLSPWEDSTKGLQGNQLIQWNDELHVLGGSVVISAEILCELTDNVPECHIHPSIFVWIGQITVLTAFNFKLFKNIFSKTADQ
jgi:hypothetical protein